MSPSMPQIGGAGVDICSATDRRRCGGRSTKRRRTRPKNAVPTTRTTRESRTVTAARSPRSRSHVSSPTAAPHLAQPRSRRGLRDPDLTLIRDGAGRLLTHQGQLRSAPAPRMLTSTRAGQPHATDAFALTPGRHPNTIVVAGDTTFVEHRGNAGRPTPSPTTRPARPVNVVRLRSAARPRRRPTPIRTRPTPTRTRERTPRHADLKQVTRGRNTRRGISECRQETDENFASRPEVAHRNSVGRFRGQLEAGERCCRGDRVLSPKITTSALSRRHFRFFNPHARDWFRRLTPGACRWRLRTPRCRRTGTLGRRCYGARDMDTQVRWRRCEPERFLLGVQSETMRKWVGGARERLKARWPSRSLLIGARLCSVRPGHRRRCVRSSGWRTRRLARRRQHSSPGWTSVRYPHRDTLRCGAESDMSDSLRPRCAALTESHTD
jgi:hypothetical protein